MRYPGYHSHCEGVCVGCGRMQHVFWSREKGSEDPSHGTYEFWMSFKLEPVVNLWLLEKLREYIFGCKSPLTTRMTNDIDRRREDFARSKPSHLPFVTEGGNISKYVLMYIYIYIYHVVYVMIND